MNKASMPQPQPLSAHHHLSPKQSHHQPQGQPQQTPTTSQSGQSPGINSSSAVIPQQQQQYAPLQTPSTEQTLQEPQQPVPQKSNTNQVTSGGLNGTPVSANEGRRISCEDIQLVQNLIERCLQLYMNESEVISTLSYQAKIEPGFTGLVWQKLEEQNPEFFKAYYTRLKLKKQIMLFNHLLEQQVQLMQLCPTKSPVTSLQNGVHPPPVHHMPIGYPLPPQPLLAAPSHPHMVSVPASSQSPSLRTGPPMTEPFTLGRGSSGTNGAEDMVSEAHLVLPRDSCVSTANCDLAMSSATMLHGIPAFPFTAMGNPADIGIDVPANMHLDTSFTASDTHAQNGIGTFQIPTDADTGSVRESLGLLGQLPRNFSLSDLTAELTSSSDILGSYSGSPFLTSDADVYIRSPDKDGLDEKMLDHMTDPLNYEDFMEEK
eukprot:c29135_g4_i1 orf=1320-2612(-)